MPESDSHIPLNKLFDLTGKGAVVTGGAQGIGLGIARRLADAGAGVIIADIQNELAEKVVKEFASYGLKVARVHCDVTDCDQVQAAIQAAVSTFGNVSILVNNAALSSPSIFKPIIDMPPTLWDKVIEVNLKGPYLCSQEAIRQMIKQGKGGAIINVGSTAGVIPSLMPYRVHYSASKGGLLMFTKSLAKEVAQYGIRVNMIAPGPTMHEGLLANVPAGAKSKDVGVNPLQRVPLGRMGTPDDHGNAALFLASEASSWMTGCVLPVDGGFLVS